MFKNRKVLSITLLCVIIFCFSGCAEKTQIEKAQDKIVEIGEQFLDYELTMDEATEQLESIAIPTTDGSGSLFLSTDKGHLIYLINKTDRNSTVFDEIEEDIQHIKNRNYNN